jgi:MFS family permease
MTDEKNIAADHRDSNSIPEHIEQLDRTHTEKDVIHTTHESPYREVNFIGTYVAILLGCNASFAGFLMPITSLALIEAELGLSPNAVWVALAWILLSAISFVLLGRLSDIFGRRWFWTGSAISALIGSIIGATANHIDVLIAASVFLGAASAAQLSFNICLGELVPLRHRFAANGVIFLSVVSRPYSCLMICWTQLVDKTPPSSLSQGLVPTLPGC